ncbi:MAG: non-canonical purine NTP pyrophosphatase [Planctomycetia bacterium]|nr:non-canonical purine NTP pyrophosphatase [Planctomycetia bacterium]
MPNLVVGSRNKKKRNEIVELLAGLPIEVSDLSAYPDAGEVVEDGGSFVANCRKKASEYAVRLGVWVLADDSGLVVPALGGAPGVDSALYAGTHGDDEANNDKLLREMATLEGERRAAHYVCILALSDPFGNIVAVSEGRCGGYIASERGGVGGFGYDPLFVVPEYHRTFGELSPRVKQAISHRARALSTMRPRIAHLVCSS